MKFSYEKRRWHDRLIAVCIGLVVSAIIGAALFGIVVMEGEARDHCLNHYSDTALMNVPARCLKYFQ